MDIDQASDETRAHRALSHRSRMRIMDVLRSIGHPVDVEEIADALGLHHNTVRTHLGILLDAGLVRRTAQERAEAGRPRWLFEAVAGEEEPSGYRLLAQILASHIQATDEDPAAAAEAAGRTWGRYLIERPTPTHVVREQEALATIGNLMNHLGFEPEVVQGWQGKDARRATARPAPVMLLHHCPFRPLVDDAPQVICSVHLGLIRGALEELRAPLRARRLDPLVEPSLCVTHLEKTEEGADYAYAGASASH